MLERLVTGEANAMAAVLRGPSRSKVTSASSSSSSACSRGRPATSGQRSQHRERVLGDAVAGGDLNPAGVALLTVWRDVVQRERVLRPGLGGPAHLVERSLGAAVEVVWRVVAGELVPSAGELEGAVGDAVGDATDGRPEVGVGVGLVPGDRTEPEDDARSPTSRRPKSAMRPSATLVPPVCQPCRDAPSFAGRSRLSGPREPSCRPRRWRRGWRSGPGPARSRRRRCRRPGTTSSTRLRPSSCRP
jgi:hypothetical protein